MCGVFVRVCVLCPRGGTPSSLRNSAEAGARLQRHSVHLSVCVCVVPRSSRGTRHSSLLAGRSSSSSSYLVVHRRRPSSSRLVRPYLGALALRAPRAARTSPRCCHWEPVELAAPTNCSTVPSGIFVVCAPLEAVGHRWPSSNRCCSSATRTQTGWTVMRARAPRPHCSESLSACAAAMPVDGLLARNSPRGYTDAKRARTEPVSQINKQAHFAAYRSMPGRVQRVRALGGSMLCHTMPGVCHDQGNA